VALLGASPPRQLSRLPQPSLGAAEGAGSPGHAAVLLLCRCAAVLCWLAGWLADKHRRVKLVQSVIAMAHCLPTLPELPATLGCWPLVNTTPCIVFSQLARHRARLAASLGHASWVVERAPSSFPHRPAPQCPTSFLHQPQSILCKQMLVCIGMASHIHSRCALALLEGFRAPQIDSTAPTMVVGDHGALRGSCIWTSAKREHQIYSISKSVYRRGKPCQGCP
jgi:hypothetical protein